MVQQMEVEQPDGLTPTMTRLVRGHSDVKFSLDQDPFNLGRVNGISVTGSFSRDVRMRRDRDQDQILTWTKMTRRYPLTFFS